MSEITVIPMTGLPQGTGPFTALCQPALPVSTSGLGSHDPDPYQLGFADGQNIAQAAFAVERQQLVRLIANAEAIRPEDNAETEYLLGQAIRLIVEDIVGDATIDPERLARQIDDALSLATEADLARTICLHPDDMALLADTPLPLDCMPDPELPPGGFRIECSAGWIEHGPTFALNRLERLLAHAGDEQ
jgi:flagellar assembly protein FliH